MYYEEEWKQIATQSIYTEMRDRLRGKICVKIDSEETLIVSVTCDEFYYVKKLQNFWLLIRAGEFNTVNFVNLFISEYRRQVAIEVNSRLFRYN